MQKYICGIDPGLSGALCLYKPGQMPILFDMPLHEITKNGKKKRQIDLYGLARFVDGHAQAIDVAIIETPSAMPGQGVTSCFNFGFNCGVVQAIIAANFIKMELVHPATWKKYLSLGADKDSSRCRASQINPEASALWGRCKDDGRAEAFLLAYYFMKRSSIGQ